MTAPLLTHANECDLAFRWQHCRDKRCLHALVLAFNPLVFGLAWKTLRKAHLSWEDGHVEELLASGTVGLLEAANLYNGQYRFSTYAGHWIFKRMLEYVRANWSVVRLPEPSAWKVAKEDQIPATIPNPQLNPFENPLSMDKRAAISRDIEIVDGESEQESSEYRALAHENMEASGYGR